MIQTQCYLEVTFRGGRALSAYYYFPRDSGMKSVRTEKVGGGLLVDYAADGRAMGIEILDPAGIDVDAFNELLVRLGMEPVPPEHLAPLAAA